MATETRKTAAELVADARRRVENLAPEQVVAEVQAGAALLVDVREPEERATAGTIAGSVQAARGVLEFYADPSSPYHRPELEPDRRVILHCASGGRSALAAAISADVSALGERVDRRLGRLAAAGVGHGGLSRREVEVARLVVQGRTSREIAADLSLSPGTVEAHVQHILLKLDARSRVDVVRRAAELGLAP